MQFSNHLAPNDLVDHAAAPAGEGRPNFFMVATEPPLPPATTHVQAPAKASADQTETDALIRYKFSVIFYPDSGVWALKNDFTGYSEQIRSCDGAKIEQFLKTQLPGSALLPSQMVLPVPINQLDMQLIGKQGQLLSTELPPACAVLQHVCICNRQDALEGTYQIRMKVKEMGHSKSQFESCSPKRAARDGRLLVPVSGMLFANPGTYMVSVQINQVGMEGGASAHSGSMVVVVR